MNDPYYLEFYGKVGILCAKCPVCGDLALIISQRFSCCGKPFTAPKKGAIQHRESIDYRKRITGKRRTKKRPSKIRQKEALHEQGYACFWCDHFFNTVIFKNGDAVLLQITWDHVTPVSKGGSNEDKNFVASCQICNGLKGSKLFSTIGDARRYLKQRWVQKGYSDGKDD